MEWRNLYRYFAGDLYALRSTWQVPNECYFEPSQCGENSLALICQEFFQNLLNRRIKYEYYGIFQYNTHRQR